WIYRRGVYARLLSKRCCSSSFEIIGTRQKHVPSNADLVFPQSQKNSYTNIILVKSQFPQYARFSPRLIFQRLRKMIFMSRERLQFSRYITSYSTRFSIRPGSLVSPL